jgi:hypothetical protein
MPKRKERTARIVKNILIVMLMLPRPLAEGETPSALPI